MRRSATFCLLAGLLAGFAGCAVGPNYQPPNAQAPAGFNAGAPVKPPATKPEKLERWWTALSDPELDSLVVRAAEANFDLGIALARLNQARSQRYVVAADLWPGLGFSGAAGRASGTGLPKSRIAGPLDSAADTTNVREIRGAAGFDTSWELDFFGHVSRAVEAATADAQAAAEARNQVLLTVVADVVRAYTHLRATQRRLDIAQQDVAAEQRILDMVRSRLHLGLTSEYEVALAERELERAKSAVQPLVADIAIAQRQIAVLLGGDPQALYAELELAMALPMPPSAVALDEPTDLLRYRPDIRQAERQLAAETARLGVATATFYPLITLSGALGGQNQRLSNGTTNNLLIYSVGPGVRWPLLDWGRVEAAAKEQDWRTREALVNYRKVVEVAIQEVDDSLGLFASEQDRFQRLQAAVEASARAVKLVLGRYDSGLTDFFNVVDAQRELYALEDQAATSQESVVVDWALLNKALGRGWQAAMVPEAPKFTAPGVSPPVEIITTKGNSVSAAGK
jgi:NodT family efflux transporter outer membrane factor (OMF) lipoprotein